MPPGVSRRQALALFGGAVAGVALHNRFGADPSAAQVDCGPTTTAPTTLPPTTTSSTLPGMARWSTLGLAGHVVLPSDVLLDVDPLVDSLRIPAGRRLVFDPAVSHTLVSRGNVTVEGVLETRPASPAVVHDIAFTGVNEAGFVGGGMDPVASDVGLWVMGQGAWNAAGSPKTGWGRLTHSAPPGTRTLTLDAPPMGWQPGDRVVVTPTEAPDPATIKALTDRGFLDKVPCFTNRYDDMTVQSVNGNTVTLTNGLINNHPMAPLPVSLGAEVLNLSRNVRLHGEPLKRAHVFVRSTKQTITHVELSYLGPRKRSGTKITDSGIGQPAPVLGRYGLHVHMCGAASRGSLYEGVVIHDAGNHAFVPHLSDGITFKDCISHNTFEDAFWWDPQATPQTLAPPTNDVLYDRCVASFVRYEHNSTPNPDRMCGFLLGAGARNVARGCVAVGGEGGHAGAQQHSGFQWHEGSHGVWTFTDNLAHNNGDNGIFTWQNTSNPSVITRFTGYHNRVGIMHGAYINRFRFEDSALVANVNGAIVLFAHSAGWYPEPLQFTNVLCDGGGISDYLVLGNEHAVTSVVNPATKFTRCTFRRTRKAAFTFQHTPASSNRQPDIVDVIDSTFDGNQLWLGNTIDPRALIRFINGSTVVNARRYDQAGTFRPEWNAKVT